MSTEFRFALVTPTLNHEYYLRVEELIILPRGSQLTTPISHWWATTVFATHYNPITKEALVICYDIKVGEEEVEGYDKRILAGGWARL